MILCILYYIRFVYVLHWYLYAWLIVAFISTSRSITVLKLARLERWDIQVDADLKELDEPARHGPRHLWAGGLLCRKCERSRWNLSLSMICWTDLWSCFVSCFQLSILVRPLRRFQIIINMYWSLGKVTSHLGQWWITESKYPHRPWKLQMGCLIVSFWICFVFQSAANLTLSRPSQGPYPTSEWLALANPCYFD